MRHASRLCLRAKQAELRRFSPSFSSLVSDSVVTSRKGSQYFWLFSSTHGTRRDVGIDRVDRGSGSEKVKMKVKVEAKVKVKVKVFSSRATEPAETDQCGG